jgi:streptogramin lyase
VHSRALDVRPRPRRWPAVLCAVLLAVGAARSVGAVADWAVGDVPPPPPTARQHYVVQPGDTLWEIARSVQPEGDIRPLVDRLIQLNGGAEVRAGDVLELRW